MAPGSPDRQTDPVRHIFEVDEGLFNLGGRQEPVAMRDQAVRACLVVDRAAAAGLLGPDRRLAIIGAGLAGATAALRAIGVHRTPVTLFDTTDQPLLAHPYICRTRWIDPTLYDGPAPHWAVGRFPLPGTPAVPLPWAANTAARVAAHWRRIWGAQAADPQRLGLLTVQPRTPITACRRRNDGYHLESDAAAIPAERRGPFAAVIAACGRGSERTWLGGGEQPTGYAGYGFWENDPLEAWNYGRGARGILLRPTVLLSGGGDGALQDLLRLTYRDPDRPDSAADPFAPGALLAALHGAVVANVGEGPWDRLCHQVAAAEDRARRDLAWVSHDGERYADDDDATILSRLDADYSAAIAGLTGLPGVAGTVGAVLEAWARPDLGQIHLVTRRPHFSQCYPLNRLLGRLLLDLAARGTTAGAATGELTWTPRSGGAVHLRLGATIAALEPIAHTCRPGRCRRERHRVDLERTDGVPVASLETDVVLIRHGLIAPPPVAGIPAVALGRQALPYALLG